MVSESLSDEEMRQRLAAGLHALDCTRCHRGAYCGGIGDDDLDRADLLMDDVVTDLLAEHTQALSDQIEVRRRTAVRQTRQIAAETRRAEAAEAEVERLRAGIEAVAADMTRAAEGLGEKSQPATGLALMLYVAKVGALLGGVTP